MRKRSSDKVYARHKILHRFRLLDFEQGLLLKTNESSPVENRSPTKMKLFHNALGAQECAGYERVVSSGEMSHLADPRVKDKLFP